MSFTNQQPWAGVAGAPDGVVMVRTANFFTLLDGPPQGVLAGQSGSASVPPDMVWDWIHKQLYICTVSSGKASDTVWTQIEFVGPFVGTDIYAQTINVSGSIQDDGNLVVKGGSDLGGPVTMDSSLTVAGDTSIGGNTTIGGTLTALQGGNLGGTFTGNPVFNFNITPIQDIKLPNNIFIESADTAGTYRRLLGTDSSNQTYVTNSGGNVVGFLNQALSTWLLYCDNGGNTNISGSLGLPGTMTSGAVNTGNLNATSFYFNGSGTVNGTLGVNAGFYPNAGIVNIGGIGGFDMYNSGGQSVLNFAPNNYIIYNGSLNYSSTGNHYFNNTLVGNGIQANYIHSLGNLDADGTIGTPGTLNAATVHCGDVNTSTVHASSSIDAAGYIASAAYMKCVSIITSFTSPYLYSFWTSGPSLYIRASDTVNIWDFGTLSYASDAQLKENIKPTKMDCLSLIRKMELDEFNWKDSGEFVPVGFTTQQLNEVFPSVVNHAPPDRPEGGIFYESVNINVMLAMLVRAVQQLSDAGMKA